MDITIWMYHVSIENKYKYMKLVLTSEHGGNIVPDDYKKLFTDKAVLSTHRAYDLGALDLFQYLKPLADMSFHSKTSRLLIELNRSLFSKQLFSEFSKVLSEFEKSKLIDTYYVPYRTRVEHVIASYVASQQYVLHLSIHSFTPELSGNIRNADLGVLYDSQHKEEQEFCKLFKAKLLKEHPSLNIRFNYPYLGKADGFTTYLRKQFPINYMGIEIEVNQKFVYKNIMDLKLKDAIYKAIDSLKKANYDV